MLQTLFALVMLSSMVGPMESRIPFAAMAVDQLAPSGLRHQEALRIDRDFGKPEFDLVVDAWSETRGGELADVRLWWAQTTEDDRRSPLSRKSERYVDVVTQREGTDRMRVAVRSQGRELAFDVALDKDGRAHVYTDVVTNDGTAVNHCRAITSRLVARRVLGIPIGLGGLHVTCVDDRGREHAGKARMRRTSAR